MLGKITQFILIITIACFSFMLTPIALAAGNQSYSQESTYKQDNQNSQSDYQASYKSQQSEEKKADYNNSGGKQDQSAYQQEQSSQTNQNKQS
ncbi:MAG: hypothetical protein VKJ02_16410 [Snowella sp.]|nr:hypothetical protein [Snowella sp.]